MNRIGHTWGAIAAYPAVANPIPHDKPELYLMALLGLLSGAGAPDWLEFRIIPHRTITHVLTIWLCIALYGLASLTGNELLIDENLTPASPVLAAIVWGFGCGGVTHWLGDVLNYKSVPILTPFDGIALGLFNSGEKQVFSCLFIFLVSLALTNQL